MFGPYSFINIYNGREEGGVDGRRLKSHVEVGVVSIILRNLYGDREMSEARDGERRRGNKGFDLY